MTTAIAVLDFEGNLLLTKSKKNFRHSEISKAIYKQGLPVMNEKWRGKYLDEAVLTGPEMRGSSPIRMDRDRQTWQTPGLSGMYPVGEGAGYAGGIVTAAVDGLRAARIIVETYAAPA